jgi:hypothetical protein
VAPEEATVLVTAAAEAAEALAVTELVEQAVHQALEALED